MPLPLFGTMTSFDTLKSSTQTIAKFGEDRAWDAIASLLDIFNTQKNELMRDLVDKTTSRLRRYGGASRMRMQRLDEMGTPQAQKLRAGAIVGFPLEMYAIALQWNRTYWKTHKANELAAQVEAVTTASMTAMIGNIKVAIFGGTNYNFTDYLVDHVDYQFSLPIRALVNADGQPIPPGPNGEVFNPVTHNHYLATASLTNSWLAALIETVIEHQASGDVYLWISRSDEQAVSLLADFKPLVFSTVEKASTQEYGVGVKDPKRLNNRQIGWFRGAAVWVKPYMMPGYYFAWLSEDGKQPLVMRVRGTEPDGGEPLEGAGDLQLVFEDEEHPLRAKAWEHEYGMSVWNRTSGAVGYVGGATYVIPDPTSFF